MINLLCISDLMISILGPRLKSPECSKGLHVSNCRKQKNEKKTNASDS